MAKCLLEDCDKPSRPGMLGCNLKHGMQIKSNLYFLREAFKSSGVEYRNGFTVEQAQNYAKYI